MMRIRRKDNFRMSAVDGVRIAYGVLSGRLGYIPLVLLLTILCGCAISGKTVKSEKVENNPAIIEKVEITRLEDGRQGFVIRESAPIDSGSRVDFARSVDMVRDGDSEQAITLLEQVIADSPGVSAPYINIAIVSRKNGKVDEAEEYLKAALELVPNHPVASNEYGLLLREQGRFAEARAVYEEALEEFPEYLPLRRNLGILCDIYLNDLGCALENYRAYSMAKPDDEQVKLWIADINLRLGQPAQ